MSRITRDLLFVRSKYNLLDLIDSRTMRYVQSIDTKGYGIFSSITDLTAKKAYLGSYDGHFFIIDLDKMCTAETGGYIKLRQGIYDMCILPDS
jgi:hypothetical protein